MNQKELIEKLHAFNKTRQHGAVSNLEAYAMRTAAYDATGLFLPCQGTLEFVLTAATAWPDLPLIIALRVDQRKAMMRMTEPYSVMYLKLRAAQLYQRVCWLNSQEKKNA